MIVPVLCPMDVLTDYQGKTVLADIYDDENVRSSMALMFPGFEYPNFQHMNVDQICRRARQEIWRGIVSSNRSLIVMLSSCGNIDHGQDPSSTLPDVRNQRAYVASLREASQICRKYIDGNELGAGNWAGGDVMFAETAEVVVAHITYNGRAWVPTVRWTPDTKEISLDAELDSLRPELEESPGMAPR